MSRRMIYLVISFLLGAYFAPYFALMTSSTTLAQSTPQAKPTTESPLPVGRESYMGRTIARTMHYSGAQWLVRDVREREERGSRMLANIGIEQGMSICDMGCGNGFYSLKMARFVGSEGRLLAVDIQPEMLAMLRTRAEQEGVENITPILGSLHNPRLPVESVDLILLVDVYHEFSHPELMLAAMRRALKPNGRIVLVEYRAEDPAVPIKPLHKMSKKQILKEFTPNGFQLLDEFEKLPWQHMMFFGKESGSKRDAVSGTLQLPQQQ